MRVIIKSTGETIAEITTNHSMTIGEALHILGYERAGENGRTDAPDYINPDTGVEVWEDDLEMIY